ncbi:hypothetical protein M9Y10_029645 [Tritrichomonas musculus]|uniref:PPPDE domain-containing protein n=1 Tax=Tritrichomonas musculus TaxID=1915356 RepID=A0ABR2KMN7_9EUKA
MSKNIYRFRVGVRKLNSSSSGSASTSLGSSGLLHAALLINTDLFEYSSAGYVRRKNVGRDSQFNWDEIGSALNGTTYVSPDDLEKAISNSGQWNGREYNALSHNCQDFVQFCLRAIGCPPSMIQKVGPCFRKQ